MMLSAFQKSLDKEKRWHSSYRKKQYAKLLKASLPSFKHGLTICIDPQENLNAIEALPKPERRLDIHHDDDAAEVLSSASMEWDAQDFFGDSWEDNEDHHRLYYHHQAFANDFIFIKIPEDIVVDAPIDISAEIAKAPFLSTILIMAGPRSGAKILLSRSTKGLSDGYLSDDIRVIAKAAAQVDIVTIQDVNEGMLNIQRRRALADRGAKVNWIEVCVGGKYTRSNTTTLLCGEGAEANTTVLYIGNARQKFDIYTASIHEAPRTLSTIQTKGVLNQGAKGLSRSLVNIGKDAPRSNGYEKQDALLLSEDAEADAIPHLEINNDDVKCGHGATIGKLDEEKLFYLMSRGLDKKLATQKMVEAYFIPVRDIFQSAKLKQKVHFAMLKALGSEDLKRASLSKDDAINVLKTVKDPEIDLDVWTLGLIYGIKVDNKDIFVKMTFTSPACPYAPQLVADIKGSLMKKGFHEPRMEFTFDPPWEPSEEVKMHLGLL
ncbi:MAG: SufD family Fe-S cluster assembly protein [Nanoarchaeota archaeon]